jgi:hypothetical protein
MSDAKFAASMVQKAASEWLETPDYSISSGPEIAPGEPTAEGMN